MKVFITGASGFIGKHLVQRLAQTEHEMRCLVRATSQTVTLENMGLELITGDVLNRDSLRKGMQGCDWVMHLANIYTFWEPDPEIYTKVNVTGTRNVLECALEAGVSKVIHVSTGVIYGKPLDSPYTEDSAVGPERFSAYAESKYQGDLVAWELFEKKGLPLVMIYPGAVMGPGDQKTSGEYVIALVARKQPMTVFLDSVITSVDVRDVADAIVKAAEKEENIGEKYLLGKEQRSLREWNEMISDISGVPLPRITMPSSLALANARLLTGMANLIKRPPIMDMALDQMRTMKEGFRFDGSKAETELGLTYTPMRTTLEDAIAWYRKQGLVPRAVEDERPADVRWRAP
jgi:dihydroflavonol-4-reductase